MKKRAVAGKLLRSILFVWPIFPVFVSLAVADVPINIFPSNQWAAGGKQENKIKKIKNENFALDDTVLSGSPEHLIVYLLSKTSYSFDTCRVNLNADYTVPSITSNYKEQQRDYDQDSPAIYVTYPDESVDIVFSTTETGISTAVAGIFNRIACAAGSGDGLGFTSDFFSQTTSVQETAPNYWKRVWSCP
jgi:hypothetical protein